MCVAAVAWDAHPDWLLVCAGNRDEFHARPAAPLACWEDGSGIIAGTDLTGGGTWLGVTEAGRFALVTNYRVPQGPQPGRPSRGRLVTDLLTGADPENMTAMNPFNLVLVEDAKAWFLTNHPQLERRRLSTGIHGLSNGGFDVPWPKTVKVEKALERWLADGDRTFAPLLDALRDETPAIDAERPEHGPEPRFSPVFIHDESYGTRCSTVLAIGHDGRGTIIERSFSPLGEMTGECTESFMWPVS
ncbi:NRDE family protein [Novosphingobium mangrovi (ex Huang et al. 2023)]|uniref:NRDE family protein n=1 Tax=Novosphingobium mangrovi (ex Huang et al. 2023) TaxID=2976432 RepID=A0ABT2I750_9SPHN|nr:NRDE family protein [Novosphingobium mangrovi (ex Huang et al. 2023)]MCT2400631.1 NRDE family protein [Novosphingobium mangrovi (ex Huang et al. 2023)]